ncbi:hypothetical protein LTR47_011976, partial [Exophiala xenobiotica]
VWTIPNFQESSCVCILAIQSDQHCQSAFGRTEQNSWSATRLLYDGLDRKSLRENCGES